MLQALSPSRVHAAACHDHDCQYADAVLDAYVAAAAAAAASGSADEAIPAAAIV